jgi:hypothetical protein
MGVEQVVEYTLRLGCEALFGATEHALGELHASAQSGWLVTRAVRDRERVGDELLEPHVARHGARFVSKVMEKLVGHDRRRLSPHQLLHLGEVRLSQQRGLKRQGFFRQTFDVRIEDDSPALVVRPLRQVPG